MFNVLFLEQLDMKMSLVGCRYLHWERWGLEAHVCLLSSFCLNFCATRGLHSPGVLAYMTNSHTCFLQNLSAPDTLCLYISTHAHTYIYTHIQQLLCMPVTFLLNTCKISAGMRLLVVFGLGVTGLGIKIHLNG